MLIKVFTLRKTLAGDQESATGKDLFVKRKFPFEQETFPYQQEFSSFSEENFFLKGKTLSCLLTIVSLCRFLIISHQFSERVEGFDLAKIG